MNRIIVIHPGSQNLRIGLASDNNPTTILHAIARRNLLPNSDLHQDAFLMPVVPVDDFDTQVGQALAAFFSQHGNEGHLPNVKLAATTNKQVRAFNKKSVPEELPLPDEEKDDEDGGDRYGKHMKIEECEESDRKQAPQEMLFDTDILKMDATLKAHYNIHFPMRRGELHLHPGIGGSLQSILCDLESIWLYAIHQRLGIAKGTLNEYNAVLVIPDIYNRSHLKELVSLLLQRMKFRCCFLLQDHVAATFGAGQSSACVVDVGHEKTSISCVEDGISNASTRVRLFYGGGDITQVFSELLRNDCSFPYRDCDVAASMSDALLLARLKEENCHLSVDLCGIHEKCFDIRRDDKIQRYTVHFGNECLAAPLSVFHTELLNITGKQKQARIQLPSSQQADPEDCFDAEYISETTRRRDHLMMDGTSLALGAGGDVADDDLIVDDVSEREAYSCKLEMVYMPNGQILPLDQAIVRCIERCPSDEMKRKMFGCILLVGGSVKFPGFAKFLEYQIAQQLASQRPDDSHQTAFEVSVCVREMDARMIAWKGAAIMCCLETCCELWIVNEEWEKGGLRVLREKAPLNW